MTIRKTGAVTGRVLGVEQNPADEPEDGALPAAPADDGDPAAEEDDD